MWYERRVYEYKLLIDWLIDWLIEYLTGVFFASSQFGIIVAFFGGGLFLKLFVDIDRSAADK